MRFYVVVWPLMWASYLSFVEFFSYCELYLFIGSDRKGIKNNMDTHVAALFFTYIELM